MRSNKIDSNVFGCVFQTKMHISRIVVGIFDQKLTELYAVLNCPKSIVEEIRRTVVHKTPGEQYF